MFPKFYQPDPNVGAVLVHSQDEMDALVAAGWPSKTPEPPTPANAEVDALRARIAALETQISAAPPSPALAPPSPPPAPVAAPVPAPVAASPAPAPKK
jgi:hypothetical protein